MIRPRDGRPVREPPWNLDVRLLRSSAEDAFEVGIVQGPHAEERLGARMEDAPHLGHGQEAVRAGSQVMEDRDRQGCVEGRIGKGQGRRIRADPLDRPEILDRKSTRLNSSHEWISYAVFCLKK